MGPRTRSRANRPDHRSPGRRLIESIAGATRAAGLSTRPPPTISSPTRRILHSIATIDGRSRDRGPVQALLFDRMSASIAPAIAAPPSSRIA
ncbi:MAG: hypothetical protein CMJ27_12725 [Phycisphaerae bacterium]|nr:hypothetical protein [Phycisphaerae bacterium]